ncbi:DUF4251 domain-containing protein [Algoriphagus lacus]|uniref:DUF4251 domain-containing protein n=1 Tax=Algoriphagus lacus TaxID=2056311 RepID=A0A418PVT2_9BACT|nr:DUF4251 domain-containing protein [Algoriphagus lacus]RIW18290.1 DUF4251 domain-containing protein [Algoriphagus lacus]
MKTLASIIIFCLSFFGFAQAQQTDPEKLQSAIDSETIVFEARQASGMNGRMIQLDPGYTLQVSPEKVVGNLPFFGRSYQGNPGSGDGGLKFEFSEFDFLVKPKKKGGWEITIEPTETSDIRSVYLTVQKNGSASLRVISNSKQGMSYNGYIKE